ncbi:MAG: MBL fold metallo-hydrolase RNA specificity domain-containing protein [Nitrososphaerales archaeon]
MREKLVTVRSGKKLSVRYKDGIVIEAPSFSLALDPKRASRCEYTFVSHAHIDHIHSPDGKSRLIASKETVALAKARGYNLESAAIEASGVALSDAGHILGSRAILVEDSVFYTGDFSRRDRGFLRGSPGVKCDTLIMETTYGAPSYVFSGTESIVAKVSKIIADCFDRCRPVVLTGYALGKAQMITYLFRNWEPIYLHESVHRMNEAHLDLGVDIPRCKTQSIGSGSSSSNELLERKPWIMVSPSASGRSALIKSVRERYGAIVIAFTGWAVEPNYKRAMGVDYAFDLSDHCDFNELVALAKYCNPSKIYTVHGFASEFAEHLRYLGFDADPLERSGQSTLSSYS